MKTRSGIELFAQVCILIHSLVFHAQSVSVSEHMARTRSNLPPARSGFVYGQEKTPSGQADGASGAMRDSFNMRVTTSTLSTYGGSNMSCKGWLA
jgi:hypothetical protein